VACSGTALACISVCYFSYWRPRLDMGCSAIEEEKKRVVAHTNGGRLI
jgi:hypothetical protein